MYGNKKNTMKKLTLLIMIAALFIAASCDEKAAITTPDNIDYVPVKKVGAIIEKSQGWGGFSTNIEMEDMSALTLLQENENILIMKTITGDVCWRQPNGSIINTIGDLDCLTGYQCYFTDECEITIDGEYTSATMPPAMPEGWSMWGCPYIYPTYPTEAYPMPNPPMPTDIIKHVPTGIAFWEYYNITQLSTLAPYEAYMVHIECGDGITPAQLKQYNGLQRISKRIDKDGTCGIMLTPAYYNIDGNKCDKEDAVMYLDEDLGVVWL